MNIASLSLVYLHARLRKVAQVQVHSDLTFTSSRTLRGTSRVLV